MGASRKPAESEWPDSLWRATAGPAPDCPALGEAAEAEVAIVGGGFTGLSAALHLAAAGRSVRVLEAVAPGWGASGRNGGQVNPGLKILPEEILARYGAERGARVVAMADAACDLVFELIRRHRIACDAIRPGYLQGGFGLAGRRRLEAWVAQWSRQGAPAALLGRRQAADLLGAEVYDAAMLDQRGGSLQPLSYAWGLARAAGAAGALIHGGSPVQAVARDGEGWRVTTPGGAVRCAQLLLCTNGYTGRLWPGLRRAVVPLPSFIMASAPLGGNIARTLLPQRHAVSETRHVQVYYRWAADGRFVLGGRGNLWDNATIGSRRHLRDMACRMFPQLEGVRWDYHWSGYVAMTPEAAPRLLRLAPGVHAGLGYNGRGVAMATMMGKQLAAAVRGEDPDLPVTRLRPIAFHAFRQAGITWHLLTGQWRDRWEARARALTSGR